MRYFVYYNKIYIVYGHIFFVRLGEYLLNKLCDSTMDFFFHLVYIWSGRQWYIHTHTHITTHAKKWNGTPLQHNCIFIIFKNQRNKNPTVMDFHFWVYFYTFFYEADGKLDSVTAFVRFDFVGNKSVKIDRV